MVTYLIYTKVDTFFQFPGAMKGVTLFFVKINREAGMQLFTGTDIRLIWMLRSTLWGLETGILVLYIVAYIVRTQAVSIAKGVMEVGFPFLVAVIPIIISFTPYNFPENIPYSSKYFIAFYGVTALLMITGGSINLMGLFTLRKSFTIMSEARAVVTNGVFRIVRHPLYLGHFIMFLGSLCLRLHWYTLILYTAFVGGQILRAHIEEKKLSHAFPAYTHYKNSTPMFFPLKLSVLMKK